MPGSYNRSKGNQFERDCVNQFKEAGFPKAKTSRAASRLADDCKIDIVGVFPYAPQCKNLQQYASINEIGRIEWEKYCEGTDGMEGRKMVPLLLTQAVRKPVMATVPWEHLLLLITHYNATT
jgi:hypothetical protein